jgi:hypothetical protein
VFDVTSAAKAGRFISFTAGLKTCSTPPWDTVNPKKVYAVINPRIAASAILPTLERAFL